MTAKILLCGLLALGLGLGCDKDAVSFHATTASIDAIELARGYDGGRGVGVGTTFVPGDTSLHAVVAVSAVPPDTGITGTWTAVDAAGVKDKLIDRSVLRAAAGTTSVHFTLTNDAPWPSGRYRFDVQIDGEGERLHSREFVIAAPASASATVALAAAPAAAEPAAAVAPPPTAAAPAPAPASPATRDATPSAPTPTPTPTPTPAAKPSAKSYPATVAGICDKMVDCGCEASASACITTLANLQDVPRSVKSCVLGYQCSGLCGTGAQKCITDHYAAEAEITRQIGEMGRKQRDNWPTGGPSCDPGYHLVGGTCYAD